MGGGGSEGGGEGRRERVELFKENQKSPPRTPISRNSVPSPPWTSRKTQYVTTTTTRVSIISTDIIPEANNSQRVRDGSQHTEDGQETEG